MLLGESGRGCDGRTAGMLHVDRYKLLTLDQHMKLTHALHLQLISKCVKV